MATERDWEAEHAVISAHAAGRERLIAQSHARLTGRELVPPGVDAAEALWQLPGVIVAHGTEEDPVFFYGNRAALTLFEIVAEDFIRLPSRFSAEPLAREERARLMERVKRENFIDDYAGVRISGTGKRFRIERASVWNLLDADGAIHGQAAWFERWEPLPAPDRPQGD